MVKRIYIVGDRFNKFADNPNVVSVSKIESDLFKGSLNINGVVYELGQGVSAERVRHILAEVKKYPGLDKYFQFSEIEKSYKNLVHKSNVANSMITKPEKLSANRYRADVYIDDQCDDIRDHITGQHIPGMALSEACRQMFLAVTELYYLRAQLSSHYFVINTSTIEYYKFVFPLDISINYVIDEFERKSHGSLKFSVVMEVVQAGKVCALVKYGFSTYDSKFLHEKESEAAIKALRQDEEVLHA